MRREIAGHIALPGKFRGQDWLTAYRIVKASLGGWLRPKHCGGSHFFLKRESQQLSCRARCRTSQLREMESCESSQVASGIWNSDIAWTTGKPSIRCRETF